MSDSFSPRGESEILESGGGEPAGSSRRGRRTAVLAGGALAGVAVLGGAAWAASWYLSSGAQPAEVLPDTTLGYVSVNLDPGGQQLLAAKETLEKFPAWNDEEIGSQGDLRKWLFEEAQQESGCEDLDYAADVEPWLGDRAAIAGVDTGGEMPVGVVAIEVKDQDQAGDGLEQLKACAADEIAAESGTSEDGSSTEDGGYAFSGDWVLLAETTQIAEDVVAATEAGSLADDQDHQRMLDEAGDAGIMTMYAAPEAGDWMVDLARETGSMGTDGAEMLLAAYEDFGGAAGQVRFGDGSMEVEFAGEFAAEFTDSFANDAGDDVVATLPADTAVAIGYGFNPGWVDALVGQLEPALGMTPDAFYAEIESATGLSLPEDVETLLGESAAVGVSGEADVEAMVNSGDFSSIVFAAKVKGDPEAIEDVLDRIRGQLPTGTELMSRSEGDYVVVGVNEQALEAFAADGDLGGQDDYQDVIPESEQAVSVVYLNADAGDDWLVKAMEAAGADEDEVDNARPLAAIGASGWLVDGVSHGKLRLTTD